MNNIYQSNFSNRQKVLVDLQDVSKVKDKDFLIIKNKIYNMIETYIKRIWHNHRDEFNNYKDACAYFNEVRSSTMSLIMSYMDNPYGYNKNTETDYYNYYFIHWYLKKHYAIIAKQFIKKVFAGEVALKSKSIIGWDIEKVMTKQKKCKFWNKAGENRIVDTLKGYKVSFMKNNIVIIEYTASNGTVFKHATPVKD